ncbi:MAG: class I SAM-dependent methyltransferase [Gemmatimonadaceae bacterium]
MSEAAESNIAGSVDGVLTGRPRPCPLCGSSEAAPLLRVPLPAVIAVNPYYEPAHVAALIERFGTDAAQVVSRCARCAADYASDPVADDDLAFMYALVNTSAGATTKPFAWDLRVARTRVWLGLLTLLARARPGRIDVRVLDLGCGWGDVLAIARAPGVTTVGVELNAEQAEHARSFGAVVVGDVADIAAHGPFDVVIANQVLEHLERPVEVLSRVAASLRPGAVGFVAVPDFSRFDWAAEQRRVDAGHHVSTKNLHPVEHRTYFSGDSLRALLTRAGLAEVAWPERDPVWSAARRVKRLVRGAGTTVFVEKR